MTGAVFPSLEWVSKEIENRDLSKWDPSYAATERSLRYINSNIANALVKEKDEAVALVFGSAGFVGARAGRSIPVSTYIELSSQLSILEDAARLWRDIADCYCAYMLWKKSPSEKTEGRLALSHRQYLSSWSRYFARVYTGPIIPFLIQLRMKDVWWTS